MLLALTRTGWSATSGNGSGWITLRQSNALNGKPSSRRGSSRPRSPHNTTPNKIQAGKGTTPSSASSLTPRIAALRRSPSHLAATSKASPANHDASHSIRFPVISAHHLELWLFFTNHITSYAHCTLRLILLITHTPQIAITPSIHLPPPRGVCLLRA